MIFQQFYLGCLAHASYLVADEQTKQAVVVDPQRDIDQYVAYAEEHGLTITHVFLTHFHADFVSGHLELRDRFGAKIVMSARAQAEFAFQGMNDYDTVEFGKVRIVGLQTPGHTPESATFLVYDLALSADKPWAALTGDTLFIGDVGRPDLLASIGVTADELAAMLYDSLTTKILPLPDETLVYPAHGAGSLCGKNLSKETVSTIGEQRRYNYALQPMSYETFKAIVTADQPEAPQYFVHDAILNRKERQTLDEVMTRKLVPLSVARVLEMQGEGYQLVDVREPLDFAGGHLRGTLNVPLQGQYATWAGTFLTNSKPIVIIAEPDGEQEAAMRLGRIGLDNIAGFLQDGLHALEAHPEYLESTERIAPQTLAEQLDAGTAPLVLDLRTEGERANGSIPGSLHIPLQQLERRIGEVPTDRPLVIHCAGGYRSAIGGSILQRNGIHNFRDLVGGYAAWSALHGQTVTACGKTATSCGNN